MVVGLEALEAHHMTWQGNIWKNKDEDEELSEFLLIVFGSVESWVAGKNIHHHSPTLWTASLDMPCTTHYFHQKNKGLNSSEHAALMRGKTPYRLQIKMIKMIKEQRAYFLHFHQELA